MFWHSLCGYASILRLAQSSAAPKHPDIDDFCKKEIITRILQLKHRSVLPSVASLEVGDLTKKINDLLVQFAAPSSVGDRDKYGCDIYNELVEFSGNIRKELDGNIFG